MNQGVARSSPVQRMVDAGSRSWCCVDNMRPPSPPRNHLIFPNQLTPFVDDSHQDLPESWSQLLLEGLADEEGKLSLTEVKKLENWEKLQLLNQTLSNHGGDVKPETSTDGYTHDIGSRVEFQTATLTTNTWSHHQMVSASSPVSCITTSTTMNDNMVDFSPKSTDLRHLHEVPSPECNGTASGGVVKKARLQPSSAQSTFKVRKEKLGDRITALHQLVSPFGKTDTASVLLEAIGYIRFLQTQIQALSLPYLGSGAGSDPIIHQNTESKKQAEKDLRSRGLCLVPISCTLHVGSEINGADYWASAFGTNLR